MSGALAAIMGGRPTMRVTVNRDNVSGYSNTVPATAQTTETVTVTPVGGKPPYTYVWTLVSGTTLRVIQSTPDQAKFSYRFFAYGSVTAVYKCTVTDAAGVVRDSPNVTIYLEAFNPGV